MVSPQKENGYTAIANEIVEQLVRTDLSGQECRLVLLILRKTYGFNKKEDAISLSQMAKLTGLGVIRCAQIMRSLRRKNIITITEKCKGKTNKYRFNKHYEQWESIKEKRNSVGTIKKKRNQVLRKNESTKDTITKDILQQGKPAGEVPSFPKGQDMPIPLGSAAPSSRDDLGQIVDLFKQLKGYNDPGWNKKHYKRHTKPAKELLRVCDSVEDALACMRWVAEECSKRGLDWTIETVCKKEPDYRIRDQKKAVAEAW